MPKLKEADILLGSDQVRRVVNPIGSPLIAFSPIQTPNSPSRRYDMKSPPIKIKTPKSPVSAMTPRSPQKSQYPISYNDQNKSEPSSGYPDSPTYRTDKVITPEPPRIPMYRRRPVITEADDYWVPY